jgi:acyl-coenzyme A synthetase/AMP-(fatty) acid ligase
MHMDDIVYADEYGTIQTANRTKDLIRNSGEWLVSPELESVLSPHEDVLGGDTGWRPRREMGHRSTRSSG